MIDCTRGVKSRMTLVFLSWASSAELSQGPWGLAGDGVASVCPWNCAGQCWQGCRDEMPRRWCPLRRLWRRRWVTQVCAHITLGPEPHGQHQKMWVRETQKGDLVMQAGRAWWVILSIGNCNPAVGGRIKVNWDHWRPGVEWSQFKREMGVEDSTEGVTQDFAPHAFVCLGPGLEGFHTCTLCIKESDLFGKKKIIPSLENTRKA